ncbi:hypothetical protein G5V59_10695 [Nocardioides sp. W3-2-3]|uniref:hypothetical protein n=1 Tax=Nocardioides convexus TaxID=2712224 RepID=UPI00241868F5|nr:hypothetical protein [Nocardioides convexus]NHA00398.1 hypothetical protein [Nocardioides convexus]
MTHTLGRLVPVPALVLMASTLAGCGLLDGRLPPGGVAGVPAGGHDLGHLRRPRRGGRRLRHGAHRLGPGDGRRSLPRQGHRVGGHGHRRRRAGPGVEDVARPRLRQGREGPPRRGLRALRPEGPAGLPRRSPEGRRRRPRRRALPLPACSTSPWSPTSRSSSPAATWRRRPRRRPTRRTRSPTTAASATCSTRPGTRTASPTPPSRSSRCAVPAGGPPPPRPSRLYGDLGTPDGLALFARPGDPVRAVRLFEGDGAEQDEKALGTFLEDSAARTGLDVDLTVSRDGHAVRAEAPWADRQPLVAAWARGEGPFACAAR